MTGTPISLAVIGAGPAGYSAAFRAADLGMSVTLIDPAARPGGVCLHRGCIPSKALLHAAGLLNNAREAEAIGIVFGEPTINLAALRAWTSSVVDKLTTGLDHLGRRRGIRYLQGRARFLDPHRLLVTTPSRTDETVSCAYAIVATGSEPIPLPLAPASPRIMDSTAALALADIPSSLLVVGGGYIGLELGQVYAALGSRVSMVDMLPALLPGADRDLVERLFARLRRSFETIRLGTRVTDMTETADGIRVTFNGEPADPHEQTFDRVLISIGRKPSSAGLGLENTAARINEKGFIEIDAQRRTAEPSLFAIGDVAGPPMLAHKGTAEARVAVDAIAGLKTAFEPAAIPAVVFTDPEIAWCGLTETEARGRGQEVHVAAFPWSASGRVATLGRDDGLSKLILEPETHRVLGVALVGPGAGELIAEGTLAIEMGAVAEDLALTIHAHPTLSETLMEAAEAAGGKALHFLGRKSGGAIRSRAADPS